MTSDRFRQDREHVLSRPERQWRALLTLCPPAALTAAPLLLSLGKLPLCTFRQLSGLPCPLCGGTHACAALAEGDLLAAWQANPGLLPLLAIALLHSLVLAHEAWCGRRNRRWRITPRVWLVGTAVLLGGWLLRLAGLL